MPVKIDEAFAAIRDERVYQDRKWGKLQEHPHTVGGWLTLLNVYLRKASDAWAGSSQNEPALEQIRKLAALGVACLQQFSNYSSVDSVLIQVGLVLKDVIPPSFLETDLGSYLGRLQRDLHSAINSLPGYNQSSMPKIVALCVACMLDKGVVPRSPISYASVSSNFTTAERDKEVPPQQERFDLFIGAFDNESKMTFVAIYAPDAFTVRVIVPESCKDSVNFWGSVKLAKRVNPAVQQVHVELAAPGRFPNKTVQCYMTRQHYINQNLQVSIRTTMYVDSVNWVKLDNA